MDHEATMKRLYELLSAGDIDGFADRVADDFVEHEDTPGFERSKALVIPGLIMSLLVRSGMYTPRWFLRLLFSPVAPLFRRRQSAG